MSRRKCEVLITQNKINCHKHIFTSLFQQDADFQQYPNMIFLFLPLSNVLFWDRHELLLNWSCPICLQCLRLLCRNEKLTTPTGSEFPEHTETRVHADTYTDQRFPTFKVGWSRYKHKHSCTGQPRRFWNYCEEIGGVCGDIPWKLVSLCSFKKQHLNAFTCLYNTVYTTGWTGRCLIAQPWIKQD